MRTRNRITSLTVAATLVIVACGSQSELTARAEPAPSTPTTVIRCPDPVTAAGRISALLPTYDYQATASPAQLADQADQVILGEVAGSGVAANGAWLNVVHMNGVAGSRVGGSDLRITIDGAMRTLPDPEKLIGLRVLAFLFQDEQNGGFQVGLEGLWLSCGLDQPAAPAKEAPSGEGWPTDPTIDQLVDLVLDPPVLLDGPVVRRSGARDLAAMSYLQPENPGQVDGVLSMAGKCLRIDARNRQVPVIWPPNSKWAGEAMAVVLEDGTAIPVGALMSASGQYMSLAGVQFSIGEQAGAAIRTCVLPDDDPEVPALVVSAVTTAAE